MLYGYLGNVTFLRGITQYLSEHEYGNAVTDELLDSHMIESVETSSQVNDEYVDKTSRLSTGVLG